MVYLPHRKVHLWWLYRVDAAKLREPTNPKIYTAKLRLNNKVHLWWICRVDALGCWRFRKEKKEKRESRRTRALTVQNFFFKYLEDEHGPHQNKRHKVHPVPEPHGVLCEVCYIGPPIQRDDLQNVVKRDLLSVVKRDLLSILDHPSSVMICRMSISSVSKETYYQYLSVKRDLVPRHKRPIKEDLPGRLS
jgi:hypothetical protein